MQQFFFRPTVLVALVSLLLHALLALSGLRTQASHWFVIYATVLTLGILAKSIRTLFEQEATIRSVDFIQLGCASAIFLCGAFIDAYYCTSWSVFRSLNMQAAIQFHINSDVAVLNGLSIMPVLLFLSALILGLRCIQTRSIPEVHIPFFATGLSAIYFACISANWIYANFATFGFH